MPLGCCVVVGSGVVWVVVMTAIVGMNSDNVSLSDSCYILKWYLIFYLSREREFTVNIRKSPKKYRSTSEPWRIS
jgi:hypothetical protein